MQKIAVIIGSTRPRRFADHAARWIFEEATKRHNFQSVLLDLRDYPMPFYQEPVAPIFNKGVYANPVAARWASTVATMDGYIIVTPEYNHSFTAVLKNALDHAYSEWNNKPVAFVGYGGVGAARAVEQLRLVSIELQMAPIKSAVHVPAHVYMAVLNEGKTLGSFDFLQASASSLLDQLSWWAKALKAARTAGA